MCVRVGGGFPLCSIIRNARIYARLTTAFDKWYRNIAYGKELCSKWKTDIRTDLCESCRAWTRVCNGSYRNRHVPGLRYKRRYTTRSIIGSVRYGRMSL